MKRVRQAATALAVPTIVGVSGGTAQSAGFGLGGGTTVPLRAIKNKQNRRLGSTRNAPRLPGVPPELGRRTAAGVAVEHARPAENVGLESGRHGGDMPD